MFLQDISGCPAGFAVVPAWVWVAIGSGRTDTTETVTVPVSCIGNTERVGVVSTGITQWHRSVLRRGWGCVMDSGTGSLGFRHHVIAIGHQHAPPLWVGQLGFI